MKKEVRIFMDHGVTFKHEFDSAPKAKEYASAVIKTGYIHDNGKWVDHYPPHRIIKVRTIDL